LAADISFDAVGFLALALRCLAIPDILLRWGCREGDSREDDGVFWCKECGWLKVSLMVQCVCLPWRCSALPSRTSCSGGVVGRVTVGRRMVCFGARVVVGWRCLYWCSGSACFGVAVPGHPGHPAQVGF
jgi:hypothetical protein